MVWVALTTISYVKLMQAEGYRVERACHGPLEVEDCVDHIGKGSDFFSVNSARKRSSPGLYDKQNVTSPIGSSCCAPSEAGDRPALPRVYLKENINWSLVVALGNKRRERRQAGGLFHQQYSHLAD